ncbi:MAG: transporter substrate-binding domain-containing protein [Enterocloster clostridioformis]
MLESGVLKVGTEGTYKPFTYHDDNNELCGYDVEAARAIGEKMGVKTEFSGDYLGRPSHFTGHRHG